MNIRHVASGEPDFGRSEGATGSGGAPHYYLPPRFLDFATCLNMLSLFNWKLVRFWLTFLFLYLWLKLLGFSLLLSLYEYRVLRIFHFLCFSTRNSPLNFLDLSSITENFLSLLLYPLKQYSPRWWPRPCRNRNRESLQCNFLYPQRVSSMSCLQIPIQRSMNLPTHWWWDWASKVGL